jgi:hypothetical protein
MKRYSIPGVRFVSSAERRSYDNTLDVFNAQIWATRGVAQARPGFGDLANTVYRDYSDQVAKFGDVVNVARPGTLHRQTQGSSLRRPSRSKTGRPTASKCLSISTCTSRSRSATVKRTVRCWTSSNCSVTPAVVALREMIDGVVGGQHVHFWGTSGGHLNGVTDVNVDDYILETRTAMTLNRVPQRPRSDDPRSAHGALIPEEGSVPAGQHVWFDQYSPDRRDRRDLRLRLLHRPHGSARHHWSANCGGSGEQRSRLPDRGDRNHSGWCRGHAGRDFRHDRG